MNIGFTYDLRSDYLKEGYSLEETAEFDRESTIEGIEEAILQLGHTCNRIGNIKRLTERLVAGDRWDLVFNICEGLKGIGREAQVPGLLDAYGIPYTFSDPLVLALTLHKGITKGIVRNAGLPTPDFLVVKHTEDLSDHPLHFPLFVKPVGEGTGKGISGASRVTGSRQLDAVCQELLTHYPEGVLVEEYLPGREFTVGITGTGSQAHVVGVMEICWRKTSEASIYGYDTKSRYEEFVEYQTPEPEMEEPCSQLALKVWRLLGCRDGGRIDLRNTVSGSPSFMEVNPLPGLDPVHSDLPLLAYRNNTTFLQLINNIIRSASLRIPPISTL